MHVNDTSEEVTFDLAYMHDGESLEQFEEFKTDMSGRPLKYKIIIKDMAIFKVLYNHVGQKQVIHKNQVLLDDASKN